MRRQRTLPAQTASHDKAELLSYIEKMKPRPKSKASPRVDIMMRTAAMFGLTQGRKERRLSWRANVKLVEAAQEKSGLEGSELLEYALAKVALEDDYVEKLFALKGLVSPDVDLEF